ncbi:hypothetical protein IEQ34_010504 [Dendrobium chrysotoxum]|uniref:Protein TIFY n=1 Tax=Dendrobium chrysotoxum TaxID=161865 RepID=A0AAV7GT02_DENCH|nr:hypothetical protein IEQ34_010504 [Dendrobium chrysotoxum]
MSSGAEIERRPEKLSFSLTCNLFSQYIKEKGVPADLSLGMASRYLGKREPFRVPTTMRLLPGVEISGDDQTAIEDGIPVRNTTRSMAPAADTKVSKKAQLTIFYGGKVLVFDNFPAEKAEDLMQLASKSSGMVSDTQSFSLMASNNLAVVDRPTCLAPANSPASFPPKPKPKPKHMFSDLPIARKASLHRFLEKRKDRINARIPYQMGSDESIKSVAILKEKEKEKDVSQPWLGLGSSISS